MHLYWTLKSFPELRDLDASCRKAAWRACCLRPFQRWQTWAAFLSQFALVLAGAFMGLLIDGQTWILSGGSPPAIETMRFPAATVGLALLAGVASTVLFGQVYSHMIRPYLRRYVQTHQVA
jgi:hypothetical protein